MRGQVEKKERDRKRWKQVSPAEKKERDGRIGRDGSR